MELVFVSIANILLLYLRVLLATSLKATTRVFIGRSLVRLDRAE